MEILASEGKVDKLPESALKYPLPSNDASLLIFSHLDPENPHTFWIQAKSDDGLGPLSQPFHYDPSKSLSKWSK